MRVLVSDTSVLIGCLSTTQREQSICAKGWKPSETIPDAGCQELKSQNGSELTPAPDRLPSLNASALPDEGTGNLPLVLHQRLRHHGEDAGALHHLSGIRRSAVVRVCVFPGTGNRPGHCAVAPEPGEVRPLADSRAVMAGARPVRLTAGSGHRPGMAPVDGVLAWKLEIGPVTLYRYLDADGGRRKHGRWVLGD